MSKEQALSASTAAPHEALGSSSGNKDGSETASMTDSTITDDEECTTIFVKIESVRRLQQATEAVYTVRRGGDGSFGLGLSEDNEIIHFYHNENAGILRIGDQVRAVNDVPLVRERLATLLQREFADQETVTLHISRAYGEKRSIGGDSFAAVQTRDENGEDLTEWLSNIWTLQPNKLWGASWELPISESTNKLSVALHLSRLFGFHEPLVGSVEIPLASLKTDTVETKWYSLRDEDKEGQHDGEQVPYSSGRLPFSNRHIEGEMLITTRKFVPPPPEYDDDEYELDGCCLGRRPPSIMMGEGVQAR